jgi:hypothetical protein
MRRPRFWNRPLMGRFVAKPVIWVGFAKAGLWTARDVNRQFARPERSAARPMATPRSMFAAQLVCGASCQATSRTRESQCGGQNLPRNQKRAP